jgi:hypothetical protein
MFGLVLPSGQKLTLDLLATIPFREYALFRVHLPFFKCILIVVISTTCESVSISSIVSKWRPFSFIFNRGNRKIGSVGDDSHVVFGKNFPGEKGSVKWRVVVKVRGEVITNFHAVTKERHSSMRN